jgi:twitching motility protein PilT
MLRAAGMIEQVRYRLLHEADFVQMIQPVTPPAKWQEFEETGDTDFAYEAPDVARFRVNLFRQRRGPAAVFRIIPSETMTLDQLGLPSQVRRVADVSRGLVVVTGPAGSGKSTTLAALIDLMNDTKKYHIITIEDPIEFVHSNKKCLIHQREIGAHATSFSDALRAAGREDPDVILVGEMRDLETISMALSAAERGTVVLGTLHTRSAVKTIDRIISVFPAGEQENVRNILGECLRAVVAQQLIPKVDGGRVAAAEILFSSPSIGNMVREGKTSQIASAIATGVKHGMIDMDGSLQALLDEGTISPRAAIDHAVDKEQFRSLVASET